MKTIADTILTKINRYVKNVGIKASDLMKTAVVETDRSIVSRSKFDKVVLPRIEEIYQWLCKGYTEYSIADELGISHTTLIEYKKNYPEMVEVFTRARAHKNALVMHKQFEKAIGYEHEDLFIAQYQGQIIEKKIKKYYPPDVNAADLYLRNNSEDYKSAKSDTGNLTLIQNNFQLPELKQQLMQIEQELKKLESPQAVDVEMIEDK